MEKIEIRKAVETDADAILDVNLDCWETTYGQFFKKEVFENRRATRDKKVAWWKQHLAGEHNAYVAVVGGKIVGYMDYFDESRTHPGYAEIGSIYILKDYQKMGIGTKFFEIAFTLAKSQKKIKMMLNVLDKNSAVEFYKKMGGKVIGDVEIEKAGEKFKEDVIEYKI